jgi:hypothetical protein
LHRISLWLIICNVQKKAARSERLFLMLDESDYFFTFTLMVLVTTSL